MTEYAVEIQPDFLERQAKALPIAAVAELIWNGLDADATSVTIDFIDDNLGGLNSIIVTDNGEGIPHADAPTLFRNLGGSWKKHGSCTKLRNRQLHGQEGRGRFKAFALGSVVDWKSTYARDGKLFRYEITMLDSDIRHVRIGDEVTVAGAAPAGVTVVVSELKRNFVSLKPENSVQEFSEIFAIYLKNYRDIAIIIGGERIDPAVAIANTWDVQLTPIPDDEGNLHPASVEVIEWRRQTKRALYLCNEQGFPLSHVETRFHVGDFHFSAYLKSPLISALHRDNRLELAEMVPALTKAVDEARQKIKDIFRDRASERAKIVVEDWKAQNLYPYEGEATTQIERAERQIFDIVAVTVQEATSIPGTCPGHRWPFICACYAMRSSGARPSCSASLMKCSACRSANRRSLQSCLMKPTSRQLSAQRPWSPIA